MTAAKRATRGPANLGKANLTAWAVAAGVGIAGSALLFTPRGYDAFAVPKLAVLSLAVAVLLLLAAAAATRGRGLVVPWSLPATIAIGAFAAALAVAAFTAPDVTIGWLGSWGRAHGALLYLAAIVVLFAVKVVSTERPAFVLHVLLGAGGAVWLYGVIQWLGGDPVNWDFGRLGTPIVSTFGNPNFASAYLGLTAPALGWVALGARRPTWQRVLAAAGVLGCLGLAALSRSIQGPIAGLAGLAVLALAVALDQPARRRRPLVAAWAAIAGAGGIAALVGLVGQAGPLSMLGTRSTFQIRRWYWEAALDMWRDNPLLGVGMSHYEQYYRAYRPEATHTIAFTVGADDPHNVFLRMFADGGALLGLAYLGFVIVIGVVLARGLWRSAGPNRALLGGFGGVWVAYQVQSFVSIDMPGLVALHFALAGAIVALTAPGTRTFGPLRGGLRWAVTPAIAVAVTLASFGTVLPLMANSQAGRARDARSAGNLDLAEAHFQRALSRTPWRSELYGEVANLYAQRGDAPAAYRLFSTALEENPRDLAAAVNAARMALRSERTDDALARYAQVIALDPVAPQFRVEYAQVLRFAGRPDEARAQLEEALRIDPENADARALLAETPEE
jgi:putative inorganic carbon (hco3(-)) transporter